MIRKLGDWVLLYIVPLLGSVIIRIIWKFIRVEIVGEEHVKEFWQRDENVIISFWHDQLLMMVMGYSGPGGRILISASKDGELIARTMRWFGHDAVRGSSSRGGKAALREMMQLAEQPYDLVFTPDGPRGPRHEIKPGVIQLARVSGRPIIPVTFVCSRGHRFASWDRFLLPFPFARGVYCYGEPLYVNRGDDLEVAREQAQTAMDNNHLKASSILENAGVSAV